MNNLDILHAVRTAEQDIGTFRLGLIYLAICTKTDKPYVGLTTTSFRQRISGHLSDARRGRDTRFCRAIRKHGADAFDWHILESCLTLTELAVRECWWIAVLGAFWHGYNSTTGGEVGYLVSDDTLAKMSAASTRTQRRLVDDGTHHWLSPEHREMINAVTQKRLDDGTHHFLSDEHRVRVREWNRRKIENGTHHWLSPEHREAASVRRTERNRVNNPMHNPETARKSGASRKRNRRLALIEAGQQVFC